MLNNAQLLKKVSWCFGTNYDMLVLNRFHKVSHTHMKKYISFRVSHTSKIISVIKNNFQSKCWMTFKVHETRHVESRVNITMEQIDCKKEFILPNKTKDNVNNFMATPLQKLVNNV